MQFEVFELERNQSLFENEVDFNLSESGVHPLKLKEILTKQEQDQILNTENPLVHCSEYLENAG